MPFVIEEAMRLVSEILEEKLNQKFESIDKQLKSIEESIKECLPIRRIVVLETITKDKAKEKIKEWFDQHPKENIYPSEIAEDLRIDYELVFEKLRYQHRCE